jgi:hypothetical protein
MNITSSTKEELPLARTICGFDETIWKYSEPSQAFTENRGGTTQNHISLTLEVEQ